MAVAGPREHAVIDSVAIFYEEGKGRKNYRKKNNKHLMTGPKGNSEFCFPETLNVPRGEAEGNIEVEVPVIKCFVIPPNSTIEKNCENMICRSGSRAELSCRNYTTITVCFFAANKS